MNILKHSIFIILLAFGLTNVSLVNAEENDTSNNVPPMMNGYGMPMMGGQWNGPPPNSGQWNGMPMMGGQWNGMPMMGGHWGGPMMGNPWGGMPMMNGYWNGGMPCQQTVNIQQMSQRLAHIEEQLDKLLKQKNR